MEPQLTMRNGKSEFAYELNDVYLQKSFLFTVECSSSLGLGHRG